MNAMLPGAMKAATAVLVPERRGSLLVRAARQVLSQFAIIGTLYEDLLSDDEAICNVYKGDSGSEADSGTTVKVSGWLIESDKMLASGTRVLAVRVNKVFYVICSNACPIDQPSP